MHKPVSIMGYYEARSFKRRRRENLIAKITDLALAAIVLMMIVWIEFQILNQLFLGGAS